MIHDRSRLMVIAVLFALLAAGCATSSAPSAANSSATDAVTQYAAAGPYAAGTFRYIVAGDPVVVWYPVEKATVTRDKKYTYHLRDWIPSVIRSLVPASFTDGVAEDAYWDAAAAPGAFPVVLFSHGFGAYPEQSSFLTAHLASWGMIVIAPDQQKRDLIAVFSGRAHDIEPSADVAEQLSALAFVERLAHTPNSLFYKHVDANKLATLGHSAGGGTAVRVAAADPAVLGWIALAGVPAALPTRSMPALMMSGSADKSVPTALVRSFYKSVRGHKAMIVIDGYGHNVFDDICTINHAHGGIDGAVKALHLPVPPAILQLANDGCLAPDLYPPRAWPLIEQAVTAQLLFDFGQNATPQGLGPKLTTAFAGIHSQYTSAG
jgi:dienelactone hydrolase